MEHEEHGQLIAVDSAMESMRDSGYDLSAAVGEVVDNSIEAKAHNIKIQTNFEKGKTKKITEMAFSDDGIGVPSDFLNHMLTMGSSTRYNKRNSLGRFGMGLKIAGISLGKRIEVYTRQKGGPLYFVYIDLEEIHNHTQLYIEKQEVLDYPERYKKLMEDESGKSYSSGTLVIWSKIDRLVNQGRYSSSLDKRLEALMGFLARTYRYFIAQGLNIFLDGKRVLLHDPLFLLANPLLAKKTGVKSRAEVIETREIIIEGHKVEFTVTLLPEEFRKERGEGGNRGQAKQFEFLHLGDNARKVSIVRNGREIFYNIIPRSFPGGRDDVDRFIGAEIKFPAQLDEYFQVRNVKRGAEPVEELRAEFKAFLEKNVHLARKMIRRRWSLTDTENAAQRNEHQDTMNIVAELAQTSPRGWAGMDVSESRADEIIEAALKDMQVDPAQDPALAEDKRRQLRDAPVSLITSDWPGCEMFEIDHLYGKPIVKLNTRHSFLREIYCKLRMVEDGNIEWSKQDLMKLCRDTRRALDLLVMAYAKAESMSENAENLYGGLKTYWGDFMERYMNELTKN